MIEKNLKLAKKKAPEKPSLNDKETKILESWEWEVEKEPENIYFPKPGERYRK